MPVKLIAHSLIRKNGTFLLIKRSKIKRGRPNVFPNYWDIPGGGVENGELPREGAIREALEEVNQQIAILKVIHEDSHYDEEKETVYTRVAYESEIMDEREIILEHVDYRWITSLSEIEGQLGVPYLQSIFEEYKI
ncbi:NUDIX hydrolase [Streptococcus cristatus]|uniref:NUDIX hydrolase n=1 Tax=Streptococcus cristatus TaxID=45634 RepID=UPI0022844626|nr:NUDIX hydrolase [Streptococcus cristatus]MCY7216844.1 NUDIX hydrolase [Streptococcus cristatus]